MSRPAMTTGPLRGDRALALDELGANRGQRGDGRHGGGDVGIEEPLAGVAPVDQHAIAGGRASDR